MDEPQEIIVEEPVASDPIDVDSPELDEKALDALVDIAPIDEDHLWLYIWLYYGFKIPRNPVCEGHCSPFDAMADMYFLRNPEVDTLWAGGRGSGKTLDLAIIEHILMTHAGDTIGNVAALDEQAQACYRYIQTFDGKPRFAHRVKRSIISRTEYHNGANLKIMPGTVRAVNSSHPRLVCLDEVDQMEWVVLQEAASMPISVNGRPPQSIFTSSLKYAYGPMVRMMDQAAEGERALRTRTWCVWGGTLIDTENGPREARSIRTGDRLWTYDGTGFHLAATDFAGQTGHRETVIVTFEDGRAIRCTPDHELLTTDGWVEAAFADGRVSVMWKSEDAASDALSTVRGSGAADASAGDLSLRVRKREAQAIQGLRAVPSQADGSHEYGAQGEIRACASAESSAGDADCVGAPGIGLIRSAGADAGVASSDRGVESGLSASRDDDGDRDLRLASLAAGERRARCASCGALACAGNCDARAMVASSAHLGADATGLLRVVSVARAGAVDVYDFSVPGTRNYVANGVVVHNCVFEIMETCEPERHQEGVGCRGILKGGIPATEPPRDGMTDNEAEHLYDVKPCWLARECLNSSQTIHGETIFEPGPGRAVKSNGYMPIDDVVKKYRTLDKDTWDSQWRSRRPSVRGLVYPMYDENVHVIDDFEWNPNLPVYCGIDFGFTNANVAVYGQLTADRKLVIFAEDWGEMRTTPELGESMKRAPWFKATIWRMGDPAAADARAILTKMGVEVVAADNTKDTAKDGSGISKVRWALKPQGGLEPFLYIARSCVNLRREMRTYHTPEAKDDVNTKEQPVKFDDHAVDAARYLVARLIKTPSDKR